jgi:hypothetical protein
LVLALTSISVEKALAGDAQAAGLRYRFRRSRPAAPKALPGAGRALVLLSAWPAITWLAGRE